MGKKDLAETAEVENTEITENTEAEETETEEFDTSKSAPADRAENGPFDLTEAPGIKPYIDLGGLKIEPRPGLGVRLDVEEGTGRVIAVSLDIDNSTVQLQAFSAPKTTGLWHEVRYALKSGFVEQSFVIVEKDGVFGPELYVQHDTENGVQTVRFVGIDGPRWLLRCVIIGEAASDTEAAKKIESVVREVVVVRGDFPMPPGELLPLQMPEGAQAIEQDN